MTTKSKLSRELQAELDTLKSLAQTDDEHQTEETSDSNELHRKSTKAENSSLLSLLISVLKIFGIFLHGGR